MLTDQLGISDPPAARNAVLNPNGKIGNGLVGNLHTSRPSRYRACRLDINTWPTYLRLVSGRTAAGMQSLSRLMLQNQTVVR
jgi:hypothetical protein